MLDLEGCKIRAEGGAHLAAALAAMNGSPAAAAAGGGGGAAAGALTRLNLARNQLGDRGAAALAEALGRNRSLVSLDLRANGLGLVGCRQLAGALRERNATLRSLAVGGNEADDPVIEVRLAWPRLPVRCQ